MRYANTSDTDEEEERRVPTNCKNSALGCRTKFHLNANFVQPLFCFELGFLPTGAASVTQASLANQDR